MKRFILLIALISLGFKGFAQNTDSTKTVKKEPVICLCCGPIDPAKQPTYVINGIVVIPDFFQFLNPNEIESIDVVKNAAAADLNISNKNGTIIIKMKKNIKWISLTSILAKNRVKPTNRNLPIYYKDKVLKADSLLASNLKQFQVTLQNNNSEKLDNATIVGKYLLISETSK
ncbi:hypothetical protein EZ428_04960 [Pedobacter frigiditerrae]|uniref:Uncharacterized protein n=1 Tax=Pedobacter frigiditerrae TaxID=2530452 RepID=A0A4R0N2S6_9SPHI|nr:hypothetical protein [Pedobacter frigiditerrae]TCC94131.1 hypothetical protein EZ428_04960 [Pedobacter frigiditerrae]